MSLRKKATVRVKSSLGKSPDWIPLRVRNSVRLLSGGDSQAGKLIRGLLWKYRYFVLLALIMNILTAVFEGSTFAFLTIALETVDGNDSTSLESMGRAGLWLQEQQATANANQIFLILMLLAVISQIMRSGFQFLGQTAAAYITAWSEGDLRRRLFHQYMAMSYAETNNHKIGDLASYTEHVTQVGALLMNINQLLSLIFVMFAYIAVLLWLSWPITLLALLALLLLSLSMSRIIRNVRQLSRQFVDAAVNVNAHVVEYINGLRVIHTFSREEYAINQTSRIIDDGVRARRQSIIWKSAVKPLMESIAIIGLTTFLLIGIGMDEYMENISVARLGVFMLVMYRLLPRITSINSSIAGISNWIPFVEHIAEMLRTDDKIYMKSGVLSFPALKQEIVFDRVSLQYNEGGETAVSDLSFTIKQGETVAFVGASGSGKSTIINLVLRLYDSSQGDILIDGYNLQELDLADWRNCIGVVDQDTFIFNDTILENIRIGRLNATEQEIKSAAKIANADEFIKNLAFGYDTEVGNRGFRLSGGQRQRLAIARAILRDPDILILDEATSALDSRSEQLIQQALAKLHQERTVIMIAHRLSTIVDADQIIVLDNGRIVEQGIHRELLEKNGRYSTLWNLQS